MKETGYHCHNRHGDLSVIVSGTPTMIERVKYWAYGEPNLLSATDSNLDGATGLTDSSTNTNRWNNGTTTYDVLPDYDLNGSIQPADVAAFVNDWNNFPNGGRGQLSRSDSGSGASNCENRFGYAGYIWDPIIGKYNVRNRYYDAVNGTWFRRDPLGYHDGMGLYEYVASSPHVLTDESGMSSAGSRLQRQPLPVSPDCTPLPFPGRLDPQDPDVSQCLLPGACRSLNSTSQSRCEGCCKVSKEYSCPGFPGGAAAWEQACISNCHLIPVQPPGQGAPGRVPPSFVPPPNWRHPETGMPMDCADKCAFIHEFYSIVCQQFIATFSDPGGSACQALNNAALIACHECCQGEGTQHVGRTTDCLQKYFDTMEPGMGNGTRPRR